MFSCLEANTAVPNLCRSSFSTDNLRFLQSAADVSKKLDQEGPSLVLNSQRHAQYKCPLIRQAK